MKTLIPILVGALAAVLIGSAVMGNFSPELDGGIGGARAGNGWLAVVRPACARPSVARSPPSSVVSDSALGTLPRSVSSVTL
ncbi:hypothetical protein BH24CHL6_BH24CHL6_00940 [soil metagenome]